MGKRRRTMDAKQTLAFVTRFWDKAVLPPLESYIRIPALSPAFDSNWHQAGHISHAVKHLHGWVKEELPNATVSIRQMTGLTPLLLIEVPATYGAEGMRTTLMYGHYDKQPPLGDWDTARGLSPWNPVILT